MPARSSPCARPNPLRRHWLVYFAVADVDTALEHVEAQGGSVTAPAFGSPYGRLATVTDPAGAGFAIITPGGPQPDRPD